mmetsp:Transcript_5141/g.7580  ORF Transcript_5141/g.7580 Transcript_5141/m.7580 type:complete len:268 (-) Transcript_5141:532-1335(-)
MFGEEWTDRMRRAAMARYALLPYLYTVFHEANTSGMPVMRSMWMEYPSEKMLLDVDDQWLLGKDLLIKPVTAPGETSVDVLLPQTDIWYDVDTMKPMPNSSNLKSTIAVTIDKIPVYQRGGSIIPRKLRLRRSSEMMKHDPYTMYIAFDSNESAIGSLYVDDEISLDHQHGKYCIAELEYKDSALSNKILHALWEEALPNNYEIERLVFMGVKTEPKSVFLTSKETETTISQHLSFMFDPKTEVLIVKKPGVSVIRAWEIRMEFATI